MALSEVLIAVAPDLPKLNKLLEATKQRKSLCMHTAYLDTCSDSFRVALNAHNEFEIRDHSAEAVAGFSPIPLAEIECNLTRLIHALEHLTRFRQIQAIINRSLSSTIRDSFRIRVGARGIWQDTDSTIQATHNEELELDIQNIGNKPLYIHIYDMGPHWQVENTFNGDFDVILPRDITQTFTATKPFVLEMSIPVALIKVGKRSCNDIIKIFITDEPTSFTNLTMQGLQNASSKSALEDLKQLPVLDAGAWTKRGPAGDWATLNIQVCTSMQEESGAN